MAVAATEQPRADPLRVPRDHVAAQREAARPAGLSHAPMIDAVIASRSRDVREERLLEDLRLDVVHPHTLASGCKRMQAVKFQAWHSGGPTATLGEPVAGNPARGTAEVRRGSTPHDRGRCS